ncbi:MAG TPA: PDZ domain-containing protein [Thermoanaerobaculia bacterium]|jgi:membrane-associated protease RseP (regulator of RpoE activity)|nr:PDZ domain-containing protein [Thermoanaerobaculia bacterium]
MVSTALNALLLALLMLLPTAPGSAGSAGDPKEKDGEDKVIVTLNDEDVELDGDEPVVLRVGRGGFLGVRLIGITDELRAHYGAPKDAGVLVAEVEPDSPAARAGIQVGDVLTTVDGERVTSTWDVSRSVRRKKGGETVEIELVRGRSSRKVSATLEERKARERTIDTGDLHDKLRRHARVWRDGDFQFKGPIIENLEDLPTLRDRLDELEKRVRELEKKLPAR